MTKKTFKDNPALQFISASQSETPLEEKNVQTASFTSNGIPKPEGYKVNPLYMEIKSRRLQLLLRPSLYSAVKETAAAAGLSVNDFIHQTLERATAAKKGGGGGDCPENIISGQSFR